MWDTPEHRWTVGLSFNLPVQLGRRRGAVDEANAMRAQYEADAARMSDTARTQVVVALKQLEEAGHVLHIFEERLLPIARQQVDAARAAFVASQAPFVSVIDAEKNLRGVELDQQVAEADYDRRRGELDRALGRMPGLDGKEDGAMSAPAQRASAGSVALLVIARRRSPSVFRRPLVALVLGRRARRTPPPASRSPGNRPATVDHYTCSMHPSVKEAAPGKCPICGMDLVPVTKEQQHEGVVMIDDARRQLIGVRTGPVVLAPMRKDFRVVGHVAYDESSLADVNLKVHGWITKLYVSETGQKVTRGQPLLSLYSPELYNAEQDFLLATQGAATPTLRRRGPGPRRDAGAARASGCACSAWRTRRSTRSPRRARRRRASRSRRPRAVSSSRRTSSRARRSTPACASIASPR